MMQNIPAQHLVIWLTFAGLWVSVALWHARENKALLRAMGMAGLHVGFVVQMVRFAWSRSAQQLIIIFVAGASLIAYDWHNLGLRAPSVFSILAASSSSAPAQLPPESQPNFIAMPQTNPQWVSYAQANAVNAAMLSNLAPAAGGISQIPALTPSAQDELDTMRQASLMQEVYAPQQGVGVQSEIDRVKQAYEDILVTFYFLQKCDRAKEEDYLTIYHALSGELRSLGAHTQVESDVMTAAKGSYQEIYSKISCISQDLNYIESHFNAYTQTLAQGVIVPGETMTQQ